MGQFIRVGPAARFAFVTEGQSLVTSGLEAVIAATGQVLLAGFTEVCPGLPAASRDGCARGLVEFRLAG